MSLSLVLQGIYMIQLLPQSESLQIDCNKPNETAEMINKYIDSHSCKTISVDISLMNILDACYVSTVCSTKHYIKYPDGKIIWKISSELVKNFNSKLELGNTDYEITPQL